MNSLNVVILAAGKGKRMYSQLPKVLHPIGGQAMLARVIGAARALNPEKIVVVIGHGKEQVKAQIQDSDLIWAEQLEQLGTGHALKMALPHLSKTGHTLVLYGDVPLIEGQTLAQLVNAAGSEASLLVDELNTPTGYGRIVRDAAGQAVAIVEEKDCNDAQKAIREINTGMVVLPNQALDGWLNALKNANAQQEYYLTDVIGLAVKDGVAVHTQKVPHSYQATGVNNKVQLAELERILQSNQAKALLEAGVTLLDPSRIDIRGRLQHGQDVIIDVNCVFEGQVELGDGVHIGPSCVLKNVKVARGTQIAAFSHFEDAIVGEDCKVGPFARLRPGATLANQVHIGNFVEIKKSQVGLASKVNHLTYIGDTEIGSRVNVGAGSVTCNYDGVNKFKTVIEDNVFIGSGTLMVAPVTIEAGATIGAGSVITKTAPKDALTVARAKQISITGWKRPVKQQKS